jgi:hypothetical protein
MFRESCNSSYTEHNKIGFAIFGFFCDFIQFFKVAASTNKRGKIHFARRPQEVLKTLQISPYFAKNSRERKWALQLSPHAQPRRSPAQFRRCAAELSREMAREGSVEYLGRRGVTCLTGKGSGDGRQRCSAPAAAAAPAPARRVQMHEFVCLV